MALKVAFYPSAESWHLHACQAKQGDGTDVQVLFTTFSNRTSLCLFGAPNLFPWLQLELVFCSMQDKMQQRLAFVEMVNFLGVICERRTTPTFLCCKRAPVDLHVGSSHSRGENIKASKMKQQKAHKATAGVICSCQDRHKILQFWGTQGQAS